MLQFRKWCSLLLIFLVFSGLTSEPSAAFVVKTALNNVPVTGQLTDGGTFTGRLTVKKFHVDEVGQLSTTGVLTGTVITGGGASAKIAQQAFTALTPLLDPHGTCTMLFLDLEPIALTSVGQQVMLVPVPLYLHSTAKPEPLLSTTLCALARLQE